MVQFQDQKNPSERVFWGQVAALPATC